MDMNIDPKKFREMSEEQERQADEVMREFGPLFGLDPAETEKHIEERKERLAKAKEELEKNE